MESMKLLVLFSLLILAKVSAAPSKPDEWCKVFGCRVGAKIHLAILVILCDQQFEITGYFLD